MTFKNNKFYNELGEIVPLEFGNNEQLKLIEKVKALRDGILFIEQFICVCGHKDNHVFVEDLEFTCLGCMRDYKFFYYGHVVPCIKSIN